MVGDKNKATCYINNSKTAKFTSRNRTDFKVEIIEDPARNLAEIKEKVIDDIRAVTKRAWGDPKQLADSWFSLSDILVIARRGNSIVGVATGKYLKQNVLIFPVEVVLPQSQNLGLGTFMNQIILALMLRKNLGYKLRSWFRPIHIAFRTQNPALYEKINKKINLTPSINERQPSAKEASLASEVSEIINPGHKFDPINFVVEGVYSLFPKLMYGNETIPRAFDEEINRFFEARLQFSKMRGDAFLVMGKLPFYIKMRLFYTKILK